MALGMDRHGRPHVPAGHLWDIAVGLRGVPRTVAVSTGLTGAQGRWQCPAQSWHVGQVVLGGSFPEQQTEAGRSAGIRLWGFDQK